MAFPKFKIADADGEIATVTDGKLDVNAVLSSSDNIEIGNVDIKLNGTGVSASNGAADAGTVRVTVASDSTGLLSVDDNGGSLTVDGTVTANAGSGTQAVSINDTSFATVEGNTLGEGVLIQGDDGNDRKNIRVDATSGDVQVDITHTVTVTDNGTFQLAANSGVDIGDVDVTSVIPGTNPLNLGKQEDAAHANGDVGVQMLAVRKGTPADLSGDDGDYEPLQLDEGRLWTSTVVTSVPAPTGGTVHSYTRFNAAETATAISDGTNGIAESVTDCKEIIIQPDPANSGFIRVGGLGGAVAGVPVTTTNGIRLEPGDTLVLPASSTDAVLIDGSDVSQRVYVMLVR